MLIEICKTKNIKIFQDFIEQIEKKEREESIPIIGRLLHLCSKFDNIGHFRYILSNPEYLDALLSNYEVYYFRIAMSGGLNCLKFFHEKNGSQMPQRTIEYCIENDNVNCFKYCFEQGCEITADVFSFVINFDSVECLKFAHQNGIPIDKEFLSLTKTLNKAKCYEYYSEIKF